MCALTLLGSTVILNVDQSSTLPCDSVPEPLLLDPYIYTLKLLGQPVVTDVSFVVLPLVRYFGVVYVKADDCVLPTLKIAQISANISRIRHKSRLE